LGIIRNGVNDLYSLTLEFDNEPDLRETRRRLLAVHGLTGELGCRRLGDGRWRLEVIAEHKLRDGVLETVKGRVVVAGAGGAGS
jgi:hypothetical protein